MKVYYQLEFMGKDQINIMIDVALGLEPLWENAIGKNWKSKITRSILMALYRKM